MSQLSLDFEAQRKERDKALDSLEDHRAWLISAATAIAIKLAMENGEVASPQVIEAMLQDEEIAGRMAGVDRRFMGVVFRDPKRWVRVRFDNIGSHSQPISVWRLKG